MQPSKFKVLSTLYPTLTKDEDFLSAVEEIKANPSDAMRICTTNGPIFWLISNTIDLPFQEFFEHCMSDAEIVCFLFSLADLIIHSHFFCFVAVF